MYKLTNANIKEWAKNYTGEPFDGILCDPPYHLTPINSLGGSQYDKQKKGTPKSARGFMGKDWDGTDENGLGIAQDPEMWHLLFNLLKPGAHLLAFSGSRTYHRMAVAIEDAGFEIRDMIEWIYGSGFPKSLNIGKAVDKLQGNERESVGSYRAGEGANFKHSGSGVEQLHEAEAKEIDITKGTSEWEGWGTALKPAHEPCVLARKPIEGTVANNVLKHGTGGLNIDGTRIALNGETPTGSGNRDKPLFSGGYRYQGSNETPTSGRFPANLIHDGSDEVEAVFPQSKGGGFPKTNTNGSSTFGTAGIDKEERVNMSDSGSASRFFYTAKASKSERNAGLEGFEDVLGGSLEGGNDKRNGKDEPQLKPTKNAHPTVKPLSLTKYLATLIKPPTGGRLLVPFSGSGSEMIGALQAGWEYVEGVELTEEYIPIAEARIKYWLEQKEIEQAKPKQAVLV